MRKRRPRSPIRRLFRRLASIFNRENVGSGGGDWWQRLIDSNGYQLAGRPSPILPRKPELSAAVALPLPPVDEGPGIVYALGHVR